MHLYTKYNWSVDIEEGCIYTALKSQLKHDAELIPIALPSNPHLFAPMPASSLHTKYPTLNWSVLLQHVCNEKKQHIILSLLAGRAQFTKVEVGDKQRQYGCGVLRTMNHPAARVEQNIIESNISEHFHHN